MIRVASRTIVIAAIAVVAGALSLPCQALAQQYPGTPVKSGQATAKYNGQVLTFTVAEGGFQQTQGFTMATIVFRLGAKGTRGTHLNLTLMFKGPGKVDLDSAFSMSGIGLFKDGDVASFTKGKGACTITLTKATPTDVEGTADCPRLHNIDGTAMPALSVQAFSATTK